MIKYINTTDFLMSRNIQIPQKNDMIPKNMEIITLCNKVGGSNAGKIEPNIEIPDFQK